MAVIAITLNFLDRHLVVLESGREQVWPLDTLPRSENWHKLSHLCQQKILNFLSDPLDVNKILHTDFPQKTAI